MLGIAAVVVVVVVFLLVDRWLRSHGVQINCSCRPGAWPPDDLLDDCDRPDINGPRRSSGVQPPAQR